MSAQEILTLAHQGHPIAIGTLLNYLTQRHGMKARVRRQGNWIHILLEAHTIPDPQQTIELVQDSIKNLEVQQITSITVYGRQQGERVPAWQQTIFFEAGHLATGHLATEPELSDRAFQFPTSSSVHANFTNVDQTPADLLDPFSSTDTTAQPMEPSETPDILKRPEAIILILFASLLIFWDAYTSLLEEDDIFPTATLSTSQLARRLQTSRTIIRRRKRLADFSNWTQTLDPDGIAWTYRKGVYIPRALEASLETEPP